MFCSDYIDIKFSFKNFTEKKKRKKIFTEKKICDEKNPMCQKINTV